ncbi:MAG TPA: ABC transporter ATP-binding protein, partial [Clostridia bacterium]|nr:ABC transporter ATP-binding protein [Clostridia bacterium]
MALIINRGVAGHDTALVLKLGGLMILMATFGYCSAFVCQLFAARASQGFGTDLRNDVFYHILRYSYVQIDDFGAPTLTNRITNDINQLQQWVAMMIRLVPRAPFICIGAIILSFFLDPKLALILLASMPVLAAIIFIITKFASPLYREYQKRLDRIARVLRENLSGVRVIRAFSKAGEETTRFKSANDKLMDTGLTIGKISSFFNPLTSLVVNFVIVLILWFGGIRISAGHLSQGQIIAFINYVNQILYALLVLSNLIILITKAMASAARVNEVLDTKPGMTGGGSKAEIFSQAPAVEFRNVSFGYNETGEKALEHVSLKIRRGETLGIIGGTGSGKTTFVNLIARFYDADSGTVLIDGTDVKKYFLPELHQKIGVVPQKALLFSGTVAENIRWGKADADEEAVAQAARTAQADEFIRELPQGYDTPISRGGTNLSGGQRQRLTIARAVVANPEILILDDASSALDFLTDARLRAAIREKSRDMTVILVSQRAGVIKNADRI